MIFTKKIYVEGHHVTAATLTCAYGEVRQKPSFNYTQLQASLIDFGCAPDSAYRAADRMLQAMRRSGEITYRAKKWHWT